MLYIEPEGTARPVSVYPRPALSLSRPRFFAHRRSLYDNRGPGEYKCNGQGRPERPGRAVLAIFRSHLISPLVSDIRISVPLFWSEYGVSAASRQSSGVCCCVLLRVQGFFVLFLSSDLTTARTRHVSARISKQSCLCLFVLQCR